MESFAEWAIENLQRPNQYIRNLNRQSLTGLKPITYERLGEAIELFHSSIDMDEDEIEEQYGAYLKAVNRHLAAGQEDEEEEDWSDTPMLKK